MALFGITTSALGETMWLGLLYLILCEVVGGIWFIYNWAEADNEFSNRVNRFVWEMRERIRP